MTSVADQILQPFMRVAKSSLQGLGPLSFAVPPLQNVLGALANLAKTIEWDSSSDVRLMVRKEKTCFIGPLPLRILHTIPVRDHHTFCDAISDEMSAARAICHLSSIFKVYPLSYKHVLRLVVEPFDARERGVLLSCWRHPRSPQHHFFAVADADMRYYKSILREVHLAVVESISFNVLLAPSLGAAAQMFHLAFLNHEKASSSHQ